MARILVAFFASVLKHFEKQRVVLINFILVLLIFACEEAVARFAFKCPCTLINEDGRDKDEVPALRQAYSALFLGVPALVFWIFGIMLQDNTWRCLSGWRIQPKFRYPGRSCACFFGTALGALMAPTAWLMFALLDGRYLDCGMSSVPHTCLHKITNTARADKYNEESADIRLKSQMAGLSLAGGLLLVYFFLMVLVRCCSSLPYYELQFAARIQQIEQQTFETAVQEELEAEFKKKWRALFKSGAKDDWIDVSEMKGSGPVTDGKSVYYSPFHEWQSRVKVVDTNALPALNSTFTKYPPSVVKTAIGGSKPNHNLQADRATQPRPPQEKRAKQGQGPVQGHGQGHDSIDRHPSPPAQLSAKGSGRQLPQPAVYGEVYHLEPMRNNSAYMPKTRMDTMNGTAGSPHPVGPYVELSPEDSQLLEAGKKRKKRAKKSQVQDSDA